MYNTEYEQFYEDVNDDDTVQQKLITLMQSMLHNILILDILWCCIINSNT